MDDIDRLSRAETIFTPVTLPCGRVVPNRLTKVSLYEHYNYLLAGPPHAGHVALYGQWGLGGWGMVLTGNFQVAEDHLGLGRDVSIPAQITPDTVAPFTAVAQAIHGTITFPHGPPRSAADMDPDHVPPLAIMQLSHGGRQSMNIVGGRAPFAAPLSASPIRLGAAHKGKDTWFSRMIHEATYQTPREMTHDDIARVVDQFVAAARLAAEAGFDGVELHAAHGYLLCCFLSPKTNTRTDEYSAITDPLRLLREITLAIRAPGVVPTDFVLGIKINAADYAQGTNERQEDRALSHVAEIARWGLIDFIEVSGGDYEDPVFMGAKIEKSPRQALFETFAQRAVELLASPSAPTSKPPPLVLLTGGLVTLPLMSAVLARNHAHLLGVGRMSVLHPRLPHEIRAALDAHDATAFSERLPLLSPLGDPPASRLSGRALERAAAAAAHALWMRQPLTLPRVLCASAEVSWYEIMLRRLAFGNGADYTMGLIGATVRFHLQPVTVPSEGGAQGGAGWRTLLLGLVGIGIGYVVGLAAL